MGPVERSSTPARSMSAGCVIPKRRAFTNGASDLARIVPVPERFHQRG